MQASELTCAQCGGRYFSGKPPCPVCTDKAHRAYVAALERVAEAARTVQVQTELGYVPASVITQSWGELDAALAALDALTEVNTDG